MDLGRQHGKGVNFERSIVVEVGLRLNPDGVISIFRVEPLAPLE
jgi:hypothetical protein